MITVITNGCFEVLHAGHVYLLNNARSLGDKLVVYLNSDRSIRQLKGPGRPLQPYRWRAYALSQLRCVDEVLPLDALDMTEVLAHTKAAVWVKGGDNTIATLPQGEVAAALANGIEIRFVPVVFDLHTSKILGSL